MWSVWYFYRSNFPGGQLQERVENFCDFYLQYCGEFIDFLMETFGLYLLNFL